MECAARPIKPNPDTQAARLLHELQTGRSVNPLVGWSRLGIYRLADVVYRLRKAGWPVVTDQKIVKNRFAEQCRVASYRLAGEWGVENV